MGTEQVVGVQRGNPRDQVTVDTDGGPSPDEVARLVDTVVAALTGPESLDESRRWELVAQLTVVRLALERLRQLPRARPALH